MVNLKSLLIGLIEAFYALFSRAPPTEPVAANGQAERAAAASDIEIIGLYRHYSAPEPDECVPYDGTDPNRYPDVWVVGREIRTGAHYLIGLEVDGYEVPLSDVQNVESPEHSEDLRIAVIRYPRYDHYRRPGEHQVNVLIGRATGDGRGVQWARKIPFTVRTVSAGG